MFIVIAAVRLDIIGKNRKLRRKFCLPDKVHWFDGN